MRAAAAEKPPAPPAERPAAAARAGEGGRSHPARRTRAGAEEIGRRRRRSAFRPRPLRRRASCRRPPPNRRDPAPPAEKTVAAAEADEPTSRGGHLPWPVRGRVLAGYGATKEGGQNAGINIAAARGAPVRAVDVRHRRLCRQRDPRLRQSRAGQASERVDFGLRASRLAARQARRHGQAAARSSRRSAIPAGSASRSCISSCAAARRRSIRANSWVRGRMPAARKEPKARCRNRSGAGSIACIGRTGSRSIWDRAVTTSIGCGRDRTRLNSIEAGELPPLAGKRVLHLQCHFGADSLMLLQARRRRNRRRRFLRVGHRRRPRSCAGDRGRRSGAFRRSRCL